MKRKDWAFIVILIIFYLGILFLFKKNIFFFKFNEKLIDRYFLSQDIPHEVKGQRLFLSDADIYIATGYLYAKGEDPSVYNFDHPPLIKYSFGLSSLLFKNPYVVQVILGISLLFIAYYLGLILFNSRKVAFLATFLLLIDPVFIDSSSQALLDLGETVIFLLYFIAMFKSKNVYIQGILLGLFVGTKSVISPLFFASLIVFYRWYKKQFDFKQFIIHLLIAFIMFSVLYLKTFLNKGGNFNIVFFILKMVKYRIQHNITSLPGASLILFLTGYFKTWWDKGLFLRVTTWTVLWPLGFIILIIKSRNVIKLKKINLISFVGLIPLTYLLFLGIQAPFPRYFMIILPFFYLTLAHFIFTTIHKFTY